MKKLIQKVILTTVVLSPLSSISLITAAAAHHTSSHVSTIAIVKPVDSKLGNTTIKPKSDVKLPHPGVDGLNMPASTLISVPNSAGNLPTLAKPNFPTLPSGSIK